MNIVTLTLEEVETDDRDANRDDGRAEKAGYNKSKDPNNPKRVEDPFERLTERIYSYRAERAVAKWFGLENWQRDPNGFGKTDVNGYQVRCGTKKGYGLVCHFLRDVKTQYPYLLVERLSNLVYRIVGTLSFADAWSLRERGIGRYLEGNTEPWCIPQKYIKKLPRPKPEAPEPAKTEPEKPKEQPRQLSLF